VGQRVSGSEGGERQCGGYGLLKLACVAQGADEAVVRIDLCLTVLRGSGDGGTKGFDRFGRRAGSEQIETALVRGLGRRFGSGSFGFCHGCFQDTGTGCS
jgi:hypothetical protein